LWPNKIKTKSFFIIQANHDQDSPKNISSLLSVPPEEPKNSPEKPMVW